MRYGSAFLLWRLSATPEHNKVDFIVMGASGSSELDKQTFGSTVENVARRAHCHVMAIRNPELAFKLPG